MGQDLGLEAKLADGLAVLARLGRGSGRGEFDVLDTKVGESSGDLDLGLPVEEGIGELLAFSECTLDDLEPVRVGEEVTDGLVRRSRVVTTAVGVAIGRGGFGLGTHDERFGLAEFESIGVGDRLYV